MATTVSLTDLMTPYTRQSFADRQYSVLIAAKFPVDSWEATSIPYLLSEANIESTFDLSKLLPLVAAGAFLEYATGDWLTLHVESHYQLTRKPAVATRRVLRITNTSGALVSKSAGEITVSNDEGTTFTSKGAVKIQASPSGLTSFIVFECDVAGEIGNVSTAAWSLNTSLPGCTVDEADGVPVITRAGAEKEQDEDFRQRAREKWSTLGSGANDDAYKFLIKNTPGLSETITRIQIKSAYPLPSQVTAWLATDSGPASTTPTLGTVAQSGTGEGISLSGSPVENVYGRVEILSDGVPGTGTFRWSRDNGETWSDELTIPVSLTYEIEDSGVILTFGASAFAENDVFVWTSLAASIDLVQAYIDPPSHLGKAPNCTEFFAHASPTETIAPVGTIYVKSSKFKAPVQAALGDALATVCNHVETGRILYLEEIRSAFMRLGGVKNVVLSTPSGDTTLADGEIAVAGSIAGLTIEVL